MLLGIFPAWASTPAINSGLINQGFSVPQGPLAAPDFTVKGLDGFPVSLSSFEGKVVFLNFWATWCPPCRIEMPSMERLAASLSADEFTIVAVSQGETPATVRRFIQAQGYKFPVFTDEQNQTAGLYNITAIPTTYLVDKKGMILGMFRGAREWDDPKFINLLKEIIKK